MNIEFVYLRARGLFGKPFQFVSDGPVLVDNVHPDKTLEKKYIVRAASNKAIQGTSTFALHEANTGRTELTDHGMFHDQGGWPKEVNIFDEEAILRYKKKVVREDNYVQALKALTKPIEHAVLQNNTINIYQKYFENQIQMYSDSESMSQIRSIYRDETVPFTPPVSHLSWSPEKEASFVASYCDTRYQNLRVEHMSLSCVWNVEIPNSPQVVFNSGVPMITMEWNPVSRNFLIGGLADGRIAYYDLRKAPGHVDITTQEVSHRDPVHSLLWLASKSGFDFFSTSSDGEIKWWDSRYLDRVLDSIVLDVSKNQNIYNAYPAAILQYDPAIPAKYLVGTENGYVFSGNRKGTTVSEKFSWVMKTHSGPLCGLERNPSCLKCFLTIGDWGAKIWAEDCRESPIIWTKQYKANLTSGGWSRSRSSVFFLTRSDGLLDVWDLLQEQKFPILSLRVSQSPLTAFRVEERSRISVVGDENGKVLLIQFGESLCNFQRNEKVVLSLMFDREGRRENILETKMREARYAMKIKAQTEATALSATPVADNRLEKLKAAEESYFEEVNKSKSTAQQN